MRCLVHPVVHYHHSGNGDSRSTPKHAYICLGQDYRVVHSSRMRCIPRGWDPGDYSGSRIVGDYSGSRIVGDYSGSRIVGDYSGSRIVETTPVVV